MKLARRPARQSFCPAIESLEDRAVPAVITVTTSADVAGLDGQVSLREALLSVNSNTDANTDVTANRVGAYVVGGQVGDSIDITGPLVGGQTIALGQAALPTITESIDVNGPGVTGLTISGSNLVRVFQITGAATNVTMNNLTIANGSAAGDGGGIQAVGNSLTLTNVTLSGNKANTSSVQGNGGGVYSAGLLNLNNTTFTGNTAALSGGAVFAIVGAPSNAVTVNGGSFTNNAASGAGGAISSAVELQVTGATFTSNTAGGTLAGSAIDFTAPTPAVLLVTNTLFVGDAMTQTGDAVIRTATGTGGSLTGVTIQRTVSRLAQVAVGGSLQINNSIIEVNRAVFSVSKTTASGTLAITGTTIARNIPLQAPNNDGGGAIFSSGGTVNVTNSTIADNILLPGAGGFGNGNDSTVVLNNTTGTFDRVTITGNRYILGTTPSTPIGVGLQINSGSNITLRNTVVSGNARSSDGVAPTNPDDVFVDTAGGPAGVLTDGGGNVIGVQNGAVVGPIDPLLGPYADNAGIVIPFGGAIRTRAPLANSPVLGAGISFGTGAVDQRGVARPTGTPADAGAFQARRPTAAPDAFTGTTPTFTVPAPGVLAGDAKTEAAFAGPLTAQLVSQPPAGQGTVALNPDGSFTFTAPAGFAGTTTFTYRATDGVTFTGPISVTLTITPDPTPMPAAPTRLFATGAGAGGGPRVRVFNADGSLRFDFFAFDDSPSFMGGVRVAVADVNGDRVDDIVVAAGPTGGPRVAVFDGTNRALLADFFAFDPSFRGGVHIAAADTDGDGLAEVVAGAGSSTEDGVGGAPRVVVIDPRTLAVRASFFAYDRALRGGVRVAAGDLDGDGRAEIVTAAGPSGGPDIGVFNGDGTPQLGADGTQVRFFAFDQAYRGGAFVSIVTDPSGNRIVVAPDSFPDFTGSFLADRFSTIVTPSGQQASAALLTASPRIYSFRLDPGAVGFAADPSLPVLTSGFLGGTRVAGGVFGQDTGVFVSAGPGGPGRVQFFPVRESGNTSNPDLPAFETTPTLDVPAFDDLGFLGGVFVGASGGPFQPPVSPPPQGR